MEIYRYENRLFMSYRRDGKFYSFEAKRPPTQKQKIVTKMGKLMEIFSSRAHGTAQAKNRLRYGARFFA